LTIFSLNTSWIRFKPQSFLWLILLIIFNFAAHANDDLEGRLYTDMTDTDTQYAVENLLIALETMPDGKKHYWKNDSYEGYITPINIIINEEGYFCRNYIEVLIKRSEYNIYENKACRDHDGEWVWFETTIANKFN